MGGNVLIRTLAVVAGINSLPAAKFTAQAENTPTFLQAVNDEGPWHEPRAEFDAFLTNNANITGEYAIPGPNISAPAMPASMANDSMISGWSWSIVVAADIPLENSSIAPADDGQGLFYYTGGKMVLNAPSSLVNSSSGNLTVDDDWRVCLFRWELRNVSYPDKLRSDNGTCGSILSDECIADMKKAAAPAESGGCQCPRASTIPSCSGLGDDSELFDTTCSGTSYDAQRLRGLKDGMEETWAFGGAAAHHSGNLTAYDEIGSLAWPVMVSFGSDQYSTASLTCVRAADTVTGSTAPSDEPSSGNSLGGSWARVVGASILVSMLMF
ncbi:hypothetical protein GGR51DRAFT_44457 [Nemania sp. FL0031]|nr:hypothetical protein GGR51DRAFT_44457 [Nemania sp. FL0031]